MGALLFMEPPILYHVITCPDSQDVALRGGLHSAFEGSQNFRTGSAILTVKRVSKSVQVLLSGIEAVMVLTLMILT